MPRRRTPDPLALAVGQRIRQLREAAGLTLEQLAFESELGSKGHLSDLERGLALPTVRTLARIASRLEALPLDLVTFPEESGRQRLVDRTRLFSGAQIADCLRRADAAERDATARAADRGDERYGRPRPSRKR